MGSGKADNGTDKLREWDSGGGQKKLANQSLQNEIAPPCIMPARFSSCRNFFIVKSDMATHLQGDHSACSKPPVDIELKVAF